MKNKFFGEYKLFTTRRLLGKYEKTFLYTPDARMLKCSAARCANLNTTQGFHLLLKKLDFLY